MYEHSTMPANDVTKPKSAKQSRSKSSTGSSKSSESPVGPSSANKDNAVMKSPARKIIPPIRSSRRRRRLGPEERKKLAQARWKKAIRRVKAMLRFQIPIFTDVEEKEPIPLAPTYKLSPDPGKKFNPVIVEDLINKVLCDRLQEYEYSRFTAPKFTKVLTTLLNERMKEFDFPRYRFVTNVLIIENKKQGISFASRCVWDYMADEYASGQFTRPTFIAVATIHGVYLD